MSAPRTIRLERLETGGGALRCEFSSSLDVFRKKQFVIRYEGLSDEAPESIRTVPFAALMAPVAMATGAELSIPSLDRNFARSLDRCREHWKRTFPRWNHDGYRLNAELVSNDPPSSGTAMLFSSGLDSISTYLHNRAIRPHLFSILGADIPIVHSHFIAECREKLFDDFARRENTGITYIHTDIRECVDSSKLHRYAPGWYASVQFGVLLTGLTAPVSYGRFSTLILASCSHAADDTAPCGADPAVVHDLQWGSTRVQDQLHEIPRVQKVARFLKNEPSMLRYLRVCWEQFQLLNCSRCKKCLRTICELLVNNIDPNQANFNIDDRTLPELRRRLSSEFHLFFNNETPTLNFWRQIQGAIDLKTLRDQYGSREFFGWLSRFEPLRRKEPRMVSSLLFYVERAQKKLRKLREK